MNEFEYLKCKLAYLRTRCTEGAEKYFDNDNYGLLKVMPVRNDLIPKSEIVELCDYLLNTGRGKKKSLEWLKKKMGHKEADIQGEWE